jgi:hypothetical protein
MAFGLPSAEQMRDYLISQGVDPAVAAERANVAARQNAAQAARTSALSIAAGAAPARAAGAAAVEAAPAVARSAMGIGERIAAAPRTAWEYLTTPAGVVRNPTTGARIPTRNVTTGRMERTPDYFLPGQRAAQGTAGGLALGAGTAGVGALTEQPAEAPRPIDPEIKTRDGWPVYFTGPQYDINDKSPADWKYATPAEVLGSRRATASAINSAYAPVGAGEVQGPPEMQGPPMPPAIQIAKQRMAAAQATGEAAPAPMRRPEEGFFSNLFTNRPATTKQLFEQSQADPSDSGAWMRAERQYARTHKDDPNFNVTKLNEQGMKRGGAANAKPDSLHKALEIIHHLLTRSH